MGPGSRLRGVGRYDVLALTASIWFLGKFLRYVFPPLFEPLQRAYGVSNADVGLAFTAFMLTYAAAQFPSGVLADRFGGERVIVGGALLAAGGATVVAAGLLGGALAGFLALAATMVVMGAGTGAHKTVAIGLLGRVYPAHTGRVLGAFDTFGTFGGVVAPLAVVAFTGSRFAMLPGTGWRWLFAVTALVAFLIAGLFVLRVPRRLRGEPSDGGHADTTAATGAADGPSEPGAEPDGSVQSTPSRYVEVFADRRLAAFVFATLAFSFGYNGLVAFLPLYLTTEAGLDAAAASGLYSLLFLVSVVQLVSGDVSDRVGQLPVVVATLGLATASIVALVALPAVGSAALPFGIAVGLAGLGMHGFRPVRGSYLLALLPSDIAAGGLGVVRTGLMGAGAVAPAVVGSVADVAGFRPAFAGLAVGMAVAFAVAASLLVGSRRTGCRGRRGR